MNNQPIENTAAPIPLRWRIRAWLFRELFATEYTQLSNYARIADAAIREARIAQGELDALRAGRPARFVLEGALPEDQLARRLAGTATNPIVGAVMALVDRKIVEMSDRATNPPTAENTAELRTYESGGANAIAEFKARLQELTAVVAEEKPKGAGDAGL